MELVWFRVGVMAGSVSVVAVEAFLSSAGCCRSKHFRLHDSRVVCVHAPRSGNRALKVGQLASRVLIFDACFAVGVHRYKAISCRAPAVFVVVQGLSLRQKKIEKNVVRLRTFFLIAYIINPAFLEPLGQ